MGSLSGEDASAGITTTGLMCSDSAEARRKLGGFWGGRGAWLGGGGLALPQGFRHGWLESRPSAELAMPGPMGVETGPIEMEPGPTRMDPGKGWGSVREGIPAPRPEGQLHPAGSHPGGDAKMSLRPHKPHIATGPGKPGKAAGDPFWALS